MNKKIVILLGIVWSLVIISGISYFQIKKISEEINIVDIEKKSDVALTTGEEEKVKIYTLSNDNTLEIREETIPKYKDLRDKIRKITELNFENLWKSNVLGTAQIEVKNIYIKGDTVYLNVDANILPLKIENRKNLLGIYSLVNSITEIGNIRKVKILVDGKEEDEGFSKLYIRNTNI